MQNKQITEENLSKPSDKEVKQQLIRILRHSEFVTSPKGSAFLRYVVDETLADRQAYIKAFSIALAVFNKDESFDPQTDPIVRVQAVRLRKMLTQYYLEDGKNDPVVISLIRGSYIPKIYFKEVHDIEQTQEQQRSIIPSIAVLPIRYLGDNEDYEYFVDGVTEEIVIKLARFSEIQVVARQATQPYKQKIIDPKILGNKLEVRYFLRGTLRKADTQLRLSVELIQANTSSTIWTKTFNKELTVDNIIEIQDDIANHVASTIAQPYGFLVGKEVRSLKQATTKNLTAYQYFLRFYQYQLTLSKEDAQWACKGLERAVEIDPSYSDAWAGLSTMYADVYRTGYVAEEESQNILDKAYEYAQTAVSTGPDNALAHFALYYVHATRNDKDAFIKAAKRAIELNPNNSIIVAQYGIELKNFGDEEEGLAYLEHAMTLNPAHPGYYHMPISFYHLYHGRPEKALQEAEKINAPDFYFTHILFALIHHALGEKAKTKESLLELERLDPNFSEHAQIAIKKWIHTKEKTERLLADLKEAGLE